MCTLPPHVPGLVTLSAHSCTASATAVHTTGCQHRGYALPSEASLPDATGTEVSGGAQERAMPEPQPRQAKCALGARPRVFPPLAHARPCTRLHACGRRAGALLMRSSTKGTEMPLVRRTQGAPRSVSCRSHSLEKPSAQSE